MLLPCRILSILAVLPVLVAADAVAQEPEPGGDEELMRAAYTGELLDDAYRPISGVFPLTFRLYRSRSAETPVWTEEQYVAVLEGMYDVQLGRNEGIPAGWAGEERVLEVALGDTVLASQTLLLWAWSPEQEAPMPTIRREPFIELAGQAIEADTAAMARNCRRLSGESASALDHYDELRGQLDEVRRRLDRPAGDRIGDDDVVLPRIGGAGGNRYERNCPPGFVMTGARGGAGNLIDGFRIICTQLE